MGNKAFDVTALGELLIDFTENGNSAQGNIEELQTMGIQNKDIRQLLIGKEIYYTGNLYDKDKENIRFTMSMVNKK